jgi:hypothetical protein
MSPSGPAPTVLPTHFGVKTTGPRQETGHSCPPSGGGASRLETTLVIPLAPPRALAHPGTKKPNVPPMPVHLQDPSSTIGRILRPQRRAARKHRPMRNHVERNTRTPQSGR